MAHKRRVEYAAHHRRIHIKCQKGKTLDCTAEANTGRDGRTEYVFAWDNAQGSFITESIADGLAGRLHLELLQQTADEDYNLAAEQPVTLELQVDEKPEKMTAMYLFNDWWTRPAFLHDFSQIPPRTQILYLKYSDRFACLVPAVGESFKTTLIPGGEDCLRMEMTGKAAWMSPYSC